MTSFDAIVLAGGAARRLGGRDKASITIGRATLLERVVSAATDASSVICVGPRRDIDRPVVWTREVPPGGGPVSAIAAGLDHVSEPVVVVLAVDLPFVTPPAVARLVVRCVDVDAAVAVDAGGRVQPLLAAYRTDALVDRVRSLGALTGVAAMRILDAMSYVAVVEPDASQDCDTPAELEVARARGGE